MSGIVNTLSSLHANILSRRRVADLQAALSRANEEASTGYKAEVYRDLGRSSAQSISLRRERERTEVFVTSNQQLTGRLDTMAESLSSARESVQEVFNLVAPNAGAPGATVTELQSAARAALDTLTARLNSSYAGVQLFAGVASETVPIQDWEGDGTGPSPKALVAATLGGGIGDATDAQAKVTAFDQIFAGGAYEGVFYRGTPEAAAARPSARIDEGTTLDYGVQASDPAFAKVFQGLSMLAGTDVSAIQDEAAYATYMGSVMDSLSEGLGGMLDVEGRLGRSQERLARTITTQQDRVTVLESRVLEMEGVDGYEAATRVNALQSQLQATYAITARMSQLSFLNFMS